MKLIFHYLNRYLKVFIISTVFLTMEAFAGLLQPTFMSYIVDKGVQNKDLNLILYYGGIMLLIAVWGGFSAIMRNRLSVYVSESVARDIRDELYHKVMGLSLQNIDSLQPSFLITCLTNDVNQVKEFISGLMRLTVKSPITCIGAVILILWQTPQQAPVLIAVIAISAVLIICNIRVGYPRFGKAQQSLDRFNGKVREFLLSIRVVKAFSAEEDETERYVKSSEALSQANTSALRSMALFSPFINLTVNFGVVVLLWLSRNQNSSEIGKLMASVNYMTQLLFSLNIIAGAVNGAVRAMASSTRIKSVLDETAAQKPGEEKPAAAEKGSLEFEHVSFRYKGASENALSDISFSVKPGSTLGIIGPTGSGKSTLAQLIPRLYDASSGKIKTDGTDVREINEEELRKRIVIVSQKSLLFSGTIRQNLQWGCETADDDEMKSALNLACADFVLSSPNGIDTVLEQGGVNLSGGQKQRLSLARAILKKPEILILDDCTCALDAATEAKVLSNLRSMKGSATVLLISQRISSVRGADMILVMDRGQIAGSGTHEELLESCPLYREICDSQIGGVVCG